MTHQYNETDNVRLLEALPSKGRIIFALLCASRVLPAYRRFHDVTGRGSPLAIEALADRLWAMVAGDAIDDSSLREGADEAERLVPSEDEGWDERTQPYAEDAAAALAYAFRAWLTESAQDAGWAGRRAYEAVDHYVRTALQESDESKVVLHPLVQSELARQRRDLLELASLEDWMVPVLRKRADAEAGLVFGGSA